MSASNKKKLRKEAQAATLTERQRMEQKEAKKLKAYTITFVVAMLLVVAIVLGVVVRGPVTGIIDRSTKAVQIGDHTLNTSELSYYYVDAITNYTNQVYQQFYSSYGSLWYLGLGFTPGTPLNEQINDKDKNTTWADYFMDEAIEDAKSAFALYDKAMAEGHKLTELEQSNLDNYFDSMADTAKSRGYSMNKYLKLSYGDGASKKSYTDYYTRYWIAQSYASAHSETLEYEAADFREYEKDKFDNYSTFSYNVYYLNPTTYKEFLKLGTKDDKGNTTYTDEENAKALEAAKKDADALVASGATTQEKLDEAIKALDINKDKEEKNMPTCTANKDVFFERVNETYRSWIKDSARKDGDMTVIPITSKETDKDGKETEKTTGYYVVMFVNRNDNETKVIDVRHILVSFEGGTKDSNGNVTYSAKEKATAKEKAEALLKQWKDGEATDESFAALAKENSTDPGSKEEGGLYEEVYPGQMVTAFNDWCFDKDRKTGDTGLVETDYGYHVMYFVKTGDLSYRDLMIRRDLKSEDMEKWQDSLTEPYKVVRLNLDRMEWDYTLN